MIQDASDYWTNLEKESLLWESSLLAGLFAIHAHNYPCGVYFKAGQDFYFISTSKKRDVRRRVVATAADKTSI